MTANDRNPEVTPASTGSSNGKTAKAKGSSPKNYYKDKIESLETEVSRLKGLLHEKQGLEAQVEAKDTALKAKLGVVDGEAGGLIDVAWGLVWAEYFHRKRMFSLVGLDARRPKTDRYGNKWSLHSRSDLTEVGDMVESLGYSLEEIEAQDMILLHCFPNQGAYDIACSELEKAQRFYLTSERSRMEAQRAVGDARMRNRPDLTEKAMKVLQEHQEASGKYAKLFNECKAVIENAVQRFYMIPMDAFESMAQYGMPIVCKTATVVPQKKHQELPVVREPQDAVVM